MRKVMIVLAVLTVSSSAHAQRTLQLPAPTGGFMRVNVESDIVKGAPYSAEVVNESVQTLADGNRIVNRTTSRVYRDSEGRTRREVDRQVRSEISISDPVSGHFYTLDPDARTARDATAMPRVFSGTVNRNGEVDALNILINGQLSSFIARGGNGVFVLSGQNSETSAEEKLAPKVIEGLRVEGIRRTTTIPAGTIGNERPIVVTSDQWTSPELKVLVLSESNDPRTGTSTYKLVNVKRGDPPASLFQVPADFTIVPGGPNGRGVGVGEGRGRSGRQ
ncbi:MAG TPA: hypothetical protein VN628_00135 [Vicinamibacterales bacterium]|nr:hypothetical protein [Vicinamibacterales bacterium]